MLQSDAALWQVAGQYAYDDSETNTEELTLRSGGEEINESLIKILEGIMLQRIVILLIVLLGILQPADAQNHKANLKSAERLYKFIVAGQGDSVHVRMSDTIRKKVAPVVFSDSFRQLEKQMGKFKSRGKWKTEMAEGITMYHCDVHFEKNSMRFTVVFDEDGRASTLTFTPATSVVDAKPMKFNKKRLEEKSVEISTDTFRLPGTLTLPKGGSRLPVLILVHGSGPNDRDETLGPNKLFRDIAWGLAEQGIAVLRYDKRTKVYGTAAYPQGVEATFDNEVVDDVISAVRLVKSLPEIDSARVYVLGHSLGGMLVPRIAQRAGEGCLGGIISLAGPVRKMEQLLTEQMTYISSLSGTQPDVKAAVEQVMNSLPESYRKMETEYQPVEVARMLKLPFLVLQGERDYQVTMQDFGMWRFGLYRNPNVLFKSYPKLNHALQEGSGKSTPFEYTHLSPVPEYVIKDIADFINGVFKQ